MSDNPIPKREQVAKRRATIALAGAALPWAYCVWMTWRLGYDAPFWDQWALVPMIEKGFDGSLRLADLWQLDNEHRVFLPNIVTIILARMSHWNHAVEWAATLAFATAAFLLLLRFVRKAEVSASGYPSYYFPALLSLMFFSFNQWRNWMWGLHLMILMADLFVIITVLLCSRTKLGHAGFAAACVAAVAASLSIGSGLAVWPAGAVCLFMSDPDQRRQSMTRLLLWAACCISTLIVYFIGFESTAASSSTLSALGAPLDYAIYVLRFMGAPLFNYSPHAALVAGLLALAFFAYILRRAYASGGASTALAGFAAASWTVACLTGLKHFDELPAQALSSRYITWSTLLWIAMACELHFAMLGQMRAKSPRLRKYAALLLTLMAVLAGAAAAYGTYKADEHHDAFLMGRRALVEGTNEDDLIWLHPDPEVPKKFKSVLMRYELSLFRK